MSVSWAWPFGNESAVTLQSLGFVPSTISAVYIDPKNAFTYTYTDSPARWSIAIDTGQYLIMPAAIHQLKGWVTYAYLGAGVGVLDNSTNLTVIGSWSANVAKGVYVLPTLVSGTTYTFRLYVDNVLKETTGNFDMSVWRYLALKYDQSGTTWSGQLYIDGVAATASYTDASVASTSGYYWTYGHSTTDRDTYIGQVIVYDDLADAGEVPRYATRGNPTSDVSEVGVWAPSAGVDNYAVVGSPLVLTDYTDEPSPNVGDNQVLDCPNITTICGINPADIDAVLCQGFASGAGQTAKAEIGDGTSYTVGPTGVLPMPGNPNSLHAVALTKPSGGAWEGSSVPRLKLEVVSTT